MTADPVAKVALLFRGDRDARTNTTAGNNRLTPIFEGFANVNVAAEPAVYSDEMTDEVRDQLLRVDGVLVWVDPIGGGEDRTKLDLLLSEVAAAGVFVRAHPDAILRMGTKEVVHATRDLGWGTDTDLYATRAEFEERFPRRLASGAARVLKQYRGNGGIGVWKVELADEVDIVRVQHAQPRDGVTEEMPLMEFIDRCEPYFSGSGRLIDQPFQPRIAEGMIRSYFVHDEVVGFARQFPDAEVPDDKVLGLPAAKTMFEPSEPAFGELKTRAETEWVPAMQRLVDVDSALLPVLWDADFLYGTKTPSGDDTYVLCEINVSAVFPFPDHAVSTVVKAAVARVLDAKMSRV